MCGSNFFESDFMKQFLEVVPGLLVIQILIQAVWNLQANIFGYIDL